jgi:hypothetical protein
MQNLPKALLMCAALGAVMAAVPASARHHTFGYGPTVVNPSSDTGGYCDNDGCPDHFWTYPIFYGPVFYEGVWYRGPVYVRDDQSGHHWFWVHGDWHRDQWHHPRPYWARDVRFGPPLDFSYYESHGFKVEGRWRHEHEAWNWNHREAWNREAPGSVGPGRYEGQGPDQGGYQGGSQPNDEWNRDRYGDRGGGNGEGWRQGPPPSDQFAGNGSPDRGTYHGQDNGNGGYGHGGAGGNWHDHERSGGQGNSGPQSAGPQGQGGPNAWGPSAQSANSAPPQNGPAGPNPAAGNANNSGGNTAVTASTGPQPNVITVKAATYGASCKQGTGNVTKFLQDACNGHDRCDYAVRYQTIGDPAPGCAKDFSVEWSCSDGTGGSASAPAEAGFGSKVTLQCGGHG